MLLDLIPSVLTAMQMYSERPVAVGGTGGEPTGHCPGPSCLRHHKPSILQAARSSG